MPGLSPAAKGLAEERGGRDHPPALMFSADPSPYSLFRARLAADSAPDFQVNPPF